MQGSGDLDGGLEVATRGRAVVGHQRHVSECTLRFRAVPSKLYLHRNSARSRGNHGVTARHEEERHTDRIACIRPAWWGGRFGGRPSALVRLPPSRAPTRRAVVSQISPPPVSPHLCRDGRRPHAPARLQPFNGDHLAARPAHRNQGDRGPHPALRPLRPVAGGDDEQVAWLGPGVAACVGRRSPWHAARLDRVPLGRRSRVPHQSGARPLLRRQRVEVAAVPAQPKDPPAPRRRTYLAPRGGRQRCWLRVAAQRVHRPRRGAGEGRAARRADARAAGGRRRQEASVVRPQEHAGLARGETAPLDRTLLSCPSAPLPLCPTRRPELTGAG
eukprot:scaffold53331_cov68-Phaeocystis_antarctica.AAC.2